MTTVIGALGFAAVLLGVSWAILWTVESYWNPVAFFGLWTGATLLMRAGAGVPVFHWRRHLVLMALSIPLWWWFEFVNGFIRNWHYTGAERYSSIEYALLASLAFSTVIPALDAAWSLTLRGVRVANQGFANRQWALVEIVLGIVAQAAVFLFPRIAFPVVWVAPWLVLDGLVSLKGGVNLAHELVTKQWGLPLRLALAGLLCGVLWEFWNFGSWPKWFYTVPYFDWLRVFEMPLLGYGGYIPFVWSVHQFVELMELLLQTLVKSADTAEQGIAV